MIHKYFQNGYYIVLDVNSGAVHVVDELFYNMLDHVSEDLAEECPEEIIRAFSTAGRKRRSVLPMLRWFPSRRRVSCSVRMIMPSSQI